MEKIQDNGWKPRNAKAVQLILEGMVKQPNPTDMDDFYYEEEPIVRPIPQVDL